MKIKVAVLLFCLSMGISVSASMAEIFKYDATNSALSVKCGADNGENFASVSILPSDCDYNSLSFADVEARRMMFDTLKREVSEFSGSYQLKDGVEAGEYIVYAQTEAHLYKMIFIVPDYDDFPEALSKANNGEDIVSFGANAAVFDRSSGQINEFIQAQKPSDGYDANTFMKAYLRAEAVAECINGYLGFEELVEKYGAWFDDKLPDTAFWSEEKFEKMDSLLAEKAYTGKTPDKILSEAVTLVNVKFVKNVTDAETEILNYISREKLDDGKYPLLNSYYKEAVLNSIYQEVSSYKTMKELYDKFIEYSDDEYLEYKKHTGSGSSSSGGGGGGVSVDVVNADVNENTYSLYSDTDEHWAKSSIYSVSERNIITGYPDKTFRPDGFISRAETAVIVTRILNLTAGEKSGFDDVKTTDWYAEYVNAVNQAQIMIGSDNRFSPDNYITRQDMAVTVYRILEYSGVKLEAQALPEFDDSGDISGYAADKIKALAANGIIVGSENKFRPMDCITRAEMAVIVEKLLPYLS